MDLNSPEARPLESNQSQMERAGEEIVRTRRSYEFERSQECAINSTAKP
jgi:hypothetical protein